MAVFGWESGISIPGSFPASSARAIWGEDNSSLKSGRSIDEVLEFREDGEVWNSIYWSRSQCLCWGIQITTRGWLGFGRWMVFAPWTPFSRWDALIVLRRLACSGSVNVNFWLRSRWSRLSRGPTRPATKLRDSCRRYLRVTLVREPLGFEPGFVESAVVAEAVVLMIFVRC